MQPLIEPAEIAEAAAALGRGELVAFPTETVYGLGANARDPAAVARIFATKGRPADHPVIVHLPDVAALDTWTRGVPAYARRLAEAFWPGPLTLVLPRAADVPDAVTGGLDTVGLRMPAHPVAQALLRAFGGGVAAPSANRYGRISPTSASHVRDAFGDAVRVLDGGDCPVGIESTIVDCSGAVPRVLRLGSITIDELARVAGDIEAPVATGDVRAPGRKRSHYAPRGRVLLAERDRAAQVLADALASGARTGWLAPDRPPHADAYWLRLPEDDAGTARALYGRLHEADALGLEAIVAVLPADAGIGRAIRDRLVRAAGLGDGDA